MTTTPQRIPDWFDLLWEEKIKKQIPLYLRNESVKKIARTLIDETFKMAAVQATTPQGVRALIAFSRIAAIVRGVNGVANAPDPSPEEVADGVQRLVEKLRERSA